jgi:pimeloyl-ACP methyl ester carboxylesterase
LRFNKNSAYHIVGGKSLQYDISKYKKVFPEMPEQNVVVVPDAGHWVHFDKPLETISLISKFLDDIDN